MVLAEEDGLVELPDDLGAGLVATRLFTQVNYELLIQLGSILARVVGLLQNGLHFDSC